MGKIERWQLYKINPAFSLNTDCISVTDQTTSPNTGYVEAIYYKFMTLLAINKWLEKFW